MAKIKSYTDLQQSRKLAEILPLESADLSYMSFDNHITLCPYIEMIDIGFNKDEVIPCWSLASLLGVLPEIDGSPFNIERVKAEDGYDGYYYHIEYKDKILIPYSKNPIDACVAMIERLHELNLL